MNHRAHVYPREDNEVDTPLTPNNNMIETAAEISSHTLCAIFGSSDIRVIPMSDQVVQDWRTWPRLDAYYDLCRSWKQANHDRAGFGFGLYHGGQLCGYSQNTLIHAHPEKGHDGPDSVNALIENIRKSPLNTPLRGYILACLSETLVAYAALENADRAVISAIISKTVEQQYPHLGFAPDKQNSNNDAWLDVAGGKRVDWARYIQFRSSERKTTCPSHLFPSI